MQDNYDKLPSVCVVTPVFNASKFLNQCAYSVINQTYVGKIEHIFIDDCSTDDSRETLRILKIKFKHIRIIENPENLGPATSRNIGIVSANTKYIAFLDADDLWRPNKLEEQIKFMEVNNCALSFTDYRFMSEDGQKVGRVVQGPNKVTWFRHHVTRSGLACLTVMYNKSLVPNFSFDESRGSAAAAEDFLGWMKIIREHGPALRCPGDLARYRVVNGSRSSNPIYKAKILWKIHRDFENLPLPTAILFQISFMISAALKRFLSKPKYNYF